MSGHLPRTSDSDLPARGRLNQAHDHWHRALDDYPYAERFFLDINALIPMLRSVTFILQKNLRHHSGFDEWYPAWQERMTADTTMRWLVDARNHIEKVGDLELHSTARVSIVADWLGGPHFDIEVPPLLPPQLIAGEIAGREGIPEALRKEGILRVERRWVAPDLPDHELLEACTYGWGFLDALVRDAEAKYLGGKTDPRPYQVRWPDCMTAGPDKRTANLHLDSGGFVEHEAVPHLPDEAEYARVEERYGDAIEKLARPDDTLASRANWYHAIGRILLEKDGYHRLIAFVIRNGRPIQTIQMNPEDQQDKYLLMDKLAGVVRSTGADEVILTGEVWVAPHAELDDARFDLRAGQREDRTEALSTSGANSDGEMIDLHTAFTRTSSGLVLSDVEPVEPMLSLFIRPILMVWGIDPIPPGAIRHRPPASK